MKTVTITIDHIGLATTLGIDELTRDCCVSLANYLLNDKTRPDYEEKILGVIDITESYFGTLEYALRPLPEKFAFCTFITTLINETMTFAKP